MSIHFFYGFSNCLFTIINTYLKNNYKLQRIFLQKKKKLFLLIPNFMGIGKIFKYLGS